MSTIIVSAADTFVFKSRAVETSAVEISAVFSFKIGTIVGIVKAIAIVAVPGGIAIIGIPGEVVLVYTCVIAFLVYGAWCRGDISGAGRNINSGTGDTESNVCIYIYL
jgi:hypothetical protein